ncbi:uncharacterized protein B0H18DRAFT_1001034 [Fomitopsis serialis]|uniref:uncharacterized protein n=1 Tax=Fomitopsis serialis TaxID=139415 RepID=UPI002007A068|nr:uncharacterized protein B0H18DRAFT_1001034 [Neoantrodia serialis]KAH9928376.1 hypothetical protein B0H18DRAFT_1001034 [Neoantrodia serialis]
MSSSRSGGDVNTRISASTLTYVSSPVCGTGCNQEESGIRLGSSQSSTLRKYGRACTIS